MGLLFYANENEDVGQRLFNMNQGLPPEDRGEFYNTIDDLTRKLQQPRDDLTITVLLAGYREELLDFISIKNLLDRVRIILILPDREKDTISIGLKLYPRFLSYADGNLKDVDAVLKKMIGNINSNYYCTNH
jgi:hypothetical protein